MSTHTIAPVPARNPGESEDAYVDRARAHLVSEFAKVGLDFDKCYPTAIGGMTVDPDTNTVTQEITMTYGGPEGSKQ